MYQKIIIVGNLGKNPTSHTTPSGQSVTNFNVAINRCWTSREGEEQEVTNWFRVSAWGKLGKSCITYLKKGSLIFCEGILAPSHHTETFEITAKDVKFLKL